MDDRITIAGRNISSASETFIIAELSANHNGSYEQAVALLRAAKEAGADAVKLQTYTADTLTLACDNEFFQIGGGTLWDGRTLHDLYQEAYMPWEWQPKLKEVADELGIALFSSPFDGTAVDFLEAMQVPAYKIASPEIIDLPLIERVARTGKPLIISTGMATLAEIDEAMQTARAAGAGQIALLHCVSAYPAPPEDMRLKTIPHLSETFGVPAGLSDHTLGITVTIAAVALGARIIEKHLTLSRSIPGPDSAFSLEPDEFAALVDAVRTTERALGHIDYSINDSEMATRAFRRSLFAVQDIQAGQTINDTNVRSIRPGHGLAPKYFREIKGKKASRNIVKGTPLGWQHISQEG